LQLNVKVLELRPLSSSWNGQTILAIQVIRKLVFKARNNRKYEFIFLSTRLSYGTKLNQSLEKIIIIGLNLTLLVTIGLPLLFTTTQVISDTEQMVVFQQFVQEVDETILLADQNQSPITKQIIVPVNVSLSTEHTQLIFKIHMGSWHMAARTYRLPLLLSGPHRSGPQTLSVNVTSTFISISFHSK
jgi:hypothetical protein